MKSSNNLNKYKDQGLLIIRIGPGLLFKSVFLMLFSSFASIAAIAQDTKYDTIQYAKEYYLKRVDAFQKEPVVTGRIIFLGNSITQFGDWKKLLGDSTVLNRGIAADNTNGVLARLNDVIIRKPARLFLEIGINDIAQSIPEYIIEKKMQSIVDRVHAGSPKTKIYVISILPTNDNVKKNYPDAFDKNDIINAIDSVLKKNAKHGKYNYVDLSSEVKDKNGNLDPQYARTDGLHLNQMGYAVWIKLMKSKKYL